MVFLCLKMPLPLQEKQKKEAAAANGKGVKQSAGELRLQKGACQCYSLVQLQH